MKFNQQGTALNDMGIFRRAGRTGDGVDATNIAECKVGVDQ